MPPSAPKARPEAAPSRAWPAFPMFPPFTLGADGFAAFAEQGARAALLAIDASEGFLTACRNMVDVSRSMIRNQQDMMLHALHAQAETAAHAEGEPPTQEAQTLFTPMLAATKVYEQMSGAVIQAQREALEALSPKPH